MVNSVEPTCASLWLHLETERVHGEERALSSADLCGVPGQLHETHVRTLGRPDNRLGQTMRGSPSVWADWAGSTPAVSSPPTRSSDGSGTHSVLVSDSSASIYPAACSAAVL